MARRRVGPYNRVPLSLIVAKDTAHGTRLSSKIKERDPAIRTNFPAQKHRRSPTLRGALETGGWFTHTRRFGRYTRPSVTTARRPLDGEPSRWPTLRMTGQVNGSVLQTLADVSPRRLIRSTPATFGVTAGRRDPGASAPESFRITARAGTGPP